MRRIVLVIVLVLLACPWDSAVAGLSSSMVRGMIVQSAEDVGKLLKGTRPYYGVVDTLSENAVRIGTGTGIATGMYQVSTGLRNALEQSGGAMSESISKVPPDKVVSVIPRTLYMTAGLIALSVTLPFMLYGMWRSYLVSKRDANLPSK